MRRPDDRELEQEEWRVMGVAPLPLPEAPPVQTPEAAAALNPVEALPPPERTTADVDPETDAPLRTVPVETFNELLDLWAEDHADEKTGLYRTDCCGARVPLEAVEIVRREHCLSASVARNGEFVAGFICLYRMLCPECVAALREELIDGVGEPEAHPSPEA